MYGLTISLAIFISASLAQRFVKRDKEILWEGLFWAILGGVSGARIYHVLDFWELYSTHPLQIFQIWKGGLGIYGALLGGIAGIVIFLKSKQQPVLMWLDVAAIVTPLGQFIGRWANYFNNELMPYAIFEAFSNLVLFFILFFLYRLKKDLKPGTFLDIYLIGYACIRLLLEPLRIQDWKINGVNIAQLISILVIIICTVLLVKTYGKKAPQK